MKRVPGLPFGLRWSLFQRSLLLQASWNNQRMQNLGFLYCLLAWLRTRPGDKNFNRRFFRRYFGFFNTNPYLAGFLLGGLVRLETERVHGMEISRTMLETYRDSLGRAFASLGDQLFWLGLRPALTLIACLFALKGSVSGVVGVFIVFSVGQLGIRWWSLGVGYQSGMDIPALLGKPFWHRGILVATRTALVMAGLVAGVFLHDMQPQVGQGGAVAFGAGILLGLGLPLLLRRRLPGEIILVCGFILSLGLGFAISLGGS